MAGKKGGAGQGDSLLVVFKLPTDSSFKALHVSRQLALQGVRTNYITEVLAAIYDASSFSGKIIDSTELASLIRNSYGVGVPLPDRPNLQLKESKR